MRTKSFAAIDMGSNTVKVTMWIFPTPDSPEVVYRHRYPIRLGRSTFADGHLSPDLIDAALETAHHIRSVADENDVAVIRGTATAALRAASNGQEVAQRIADETGIEIDIISSDREGELTSRGALLGFDLSHGAAIVDIGGGSAEVTLTQPDGSCDTTSLLLGAVLLTESHLASDPPTQAELESLTRHVDSIIADSGIQPSDRVVVGCGGTLVSVGLMVASLQTSRDLLAGDEIPPVAIDDLESLFQEMVTLTAQERADRYGLEFQRAEVIVGGAIALRQLLATLGAQTLQITSRGLREGLLLEHMETESR